jgi:hypothetical protein
MKTLHLYIEVFTWIYIQLQFLDLEEVFTVKFNYIVLDFFRLKVSMFESVSLDYEFQHDLEFECKFQ